MSDWNKFFRKVRKVRDVLFTDVLAAIPGLALAEALTLLPKVQQRIIELGGKLPDTQTSSGMAWGAHGPEEDGA